MIPQSGGFNGGGPDGAPARPCRRDAPRAPAIIILRGHNSHNQARAAACGPGLPLNMFSRPLWPPIDLGPNKHDHPRGRPQPRARSPRTHTTHAQVVRLGSHAGDQALNELWALCGLTHHEPSERVVHLMEAMQVRGAQAPSV
jgi:hypothetical protein